MDKNLKNKVVEFPLSNEMKLPDLTRKGFQRHEVVALFTELAAKGMGIYTEGTRGKGNCATFEFWQEFPETYSMTFQVEKLHNDYAGKPMAMTPEPPRRNPVAPQCAGSEPTRLSPDMGGVRRTSLTASQYKVIVNDTGLSVVLVDKGATSIEAAVCEVWSEIKDKVVAPHYNHMTSLEVVASRLMGLGYYNFS